MIKQAAFISAVLCAGTLSALSDGIARYDFGTPKSPLRQGFTRVTHLKGSGYIWNTRSKLKSVASEIIESRANARRNTIEPPPVYFNDLSCDHVTGTADAELTLKVPAGRYMVWAVSGPAGGKRVRNFVWNTRMGGEEINNWKNYANGEFVFPVTADSNGAKIKIQTKSAWAINTMLLIPANKWESYRKSAEFKELHNEMFFLSAERLKKWELLPQPIVRKAPPVKWSAQQQQQGFAVFRRGYADPVFPSEYPWANEINAPLRCFAAGKERESLTFTVRSLKDIRSVAVKVSTLAGPNGKQLAAPEIRYVRYMFVRPHYTILNQYFEAPDILMPYRKPLELEKNRNLRFMLTVNVPAGTAPGIYSGKVTLSCDKVTRTLPLTVKVLGFDLKQDPGKIYSIYYNVPAPEAVSDSPFTRAWLENKRKSELSGLQADGFTGVTIGFWATHPKGKELRVLIENFKRSAEELGNYGITAPTPAGYGEGRLYADNMKKRLPPHLTGMEMPNEAYFKDVEETVKKIFAEYKKNPQWPEPLIYLTDEPDCTATVVAYLKRVGEIVKRNGGRTYVTASPANKLFAPLFDVVDVWCPPSYALTPEQMREWQKKRPGTEFWCYPNSVCGSNNHVTFQGARMTFGYGFWKSEFKALIPWMYQSIGGSQWNYLDAARMDFLNRTDNDGSVIPAMNYLCYREGIDDARYIYTLQTRIKEARKAGLTAVARQGEKVIADLSAAIPVRRRYKDHADGVWDTGTMDAWRWKVACMITEIDSALKQKGGR